MRGINFAFSGFKRIEVEGYNQNRLLTELFSQGITINKLEKISPKRMLFNVNNKQCEKTFAILEKLCYNYTVTESHGIKNLLSLALKRIGLIISAVVFCGFSIFGSFFIWRVEIDGNEKIDELVIERALRDKGIAVGKKKSAFNPFDVRMLINDIEGIAESSVELVGTTLKITVFEDTEYTDPILPKEFSLISDYDATITRIIVEDGTSKVNIGDNVASGSELISGEIFDTNGESLGYKEARGQVYGIVNFNASVIFSDVSVIEKETGNKQTRTQLELFGLKIGGGKPVEFDSYNKVTTSDFVTKNLFVPLKYTKSVYYETVRETIENDIDLLTEQWKKEKILELIINCGGSETEVITVSTAIGGNLTKVDLFLQAEMPLISK